MSGSLAERALAALGQRGGERLCWLDGGGGARSLLGCRPSEEIVGDDLALLDRVEPSWRAQSSSGGQPSGQPSGPPSGPPSGWIGWISYDLGAAELLGRPPRRLPFPHLCMRRFDRLEQEPAGPVAVTGVENPWPLGPLRAELEPERYREQVRRIKAHIAAGDTYQVNLSQRFVADWRDRSQPLWSRIAAVHRRLRAATPATMGALLVIDDERAIVSNSPETLLDVRFGAGERGYDLARSWPIKGTRPRFADARADQAAAAELRASEKDRAEHVMIVDLVRNDLGQLALPGSVRAPSEPELVSLPTVHHLVSEVSCTLAPGWSLRELLAALFPGGSITGAPKRRTVELIDEIEAGPRGIYCGAIVLLEPTGLRMSIPIRTALLDTRGLELRSGGGIVIDSDPEAERLETLAKARAFEVEPTIG